MDVVDPELGIDVVNLGLIYGIHIDDSNIATVDMTLTSAACPLTDVIEDQAKSATDGLVNELRINWVWMPPWGPDKITDDGREQLRGARLQRLTQEPVRGAVAMGHGPFGALGPRSRCVRSYTWDILLLAGAIAAEVAATTAMKYSEGFSRLWPSLVTALGYVVSFALLAQTLKTVQIGTAYAIWSGVGTATIAVLGLLLFGEGARAWPRSPGSC